jgi:hypothetical protein
MSELTLPSSAVPDSSSVLCICSPSSTPSAPTCFATRATPSCRCRVRPAVRRPAVAPPVASPPGCGLERQFGSDATGSSPCSHPPGRPASRPPVSRTRLVITSRDRRRARTQPSGSLTIGRSVRRSLVIRDDYTSAPRAPHALERRLGDPGPRLDQRHVPQRHSGLSSHTGTAQYTGPDQHDQFRTSAVVNGHIGQEHGRFARQEKSGSTTRTPAMRERSSSSSPTAWDPCRR